MRVVAGLGNPGKRYERSRHNLGFRVVDRAAERLGVTGWKTQFDALTARGQAADGAYLLVKPQTFMNLSGVSVGAVLRYHRLPPEACLVVVDDLDLELGKVRVRESGSDGGHKGLRSVIEHVGTAGFKRIRIGIGRPAEGGSVIGHVLGGSAADEQALAAATDIAVERVVEYVETGRLENWSSS